MCIHSNASLYLCFLYYFLGQISLEEFMEGAQRDTWVMEQLRLDLRPTHWFIKHQDKNS